MTKRRRFTDNFKAKIALEALRGDQTLSQIAARHKLHPNQISQWRLQALDGRGRYLDNIFIERLWQSLKYEAVYLHEMSDGFAAKRVIGDWISFYNTQRPHSALDGNTPDMAYGAAQTRNLAA
ncbi:MAG: transposase [Robiginitomaculum sp.]|nr:transposase [Robiginitomaculum sp.]